MTLKATATSGGATLTQYQLQPLESVIAHCSTASSNKMYFPLSANTANAPSNNKKKYLDRLVQNDPGGDISWDTDTGGSVDSLIIAGVETSAKAGKLQDFAKNLGTAPTGTVAFTSGAITVGHLTTQNTKIQDFNTQLAAGTAPDGAVTFTSGAITVGHLTTQNAKIQDFNTQLQAGVAPTGAVTFTGGAITVGFDGTKHGYLTELAAADPATNAISYVDYGTDLDANSNCVGTTKLICEAVR
jgi:hypothetical protein